MGFDIVSNPSNDILLIPGDTGLEPTTSTSPSSMPGLSRSDGTTSTLSPGTDFPILPLPKSARGDRQPSQGDDDPHADEASDEDDPDDWDMVHPDPDAWVGIETGHHQAGSTGDNTDDELIFLDEESLMAMKQADDQKKKEKKSVGGDGKNKRGRTLMMDYAGIVKA